jgi:hypothetical protein
MRIGRSGLARRMPTGAWTPTIVRGLIVVLALIPL